MNPGRILISQVGIVLVVIIAAQWLATQWTAEALGYQPALGPPWFVVGEQPVYLPWLVFHDGASSP